MIQALSPRNRRGYSWVGLAFMLAGWSANTAVAQSTPKNDEPAKKAAAPADAPPPAGDDEAASKVAPVEVFKDPRAEAAIGVFKTVAGLRDCREQDVRAVRDMAGGGQNPDQATIRRFVQGMAFRLTSKTNLNAIIDRPPGANPRSPVFFAINEAATNLIDTLNSAKKGGNTAFLTTYNKELLDTLPKLLDNNLIARIIAMIVLGQTGDRNAWNTFLTVLRDKDQPPSVSLWAAKGLSNLMGDGARVDVLGASQTIDAAKTLVEYLNREDGLPWPFTLRILEAIGSTRLAAIPSNQQQAEVAAAAMGYLSDPEAKFEVRAEAGRVLGVVRVNPTIAKYNFGLVAYDLGVLTSEIAAEIAAVSKDNPVRAEYLSALLAVPIFQAFNGVEGLRESGLSKVPGGNPNIAAYQDAIKAIRDQQANIAKVAVEMTRPGTPKGAIPPLLKELNDQVGELKQYLVKNPPKDFHLVPGGKEYQLPVEAPVAEKPAEEKKNEDKKVTTGGGK